MRQHYQQHESTESLVGPQRAYLESVRPTLFTVEQFSLAQPAFTGPAVRNLIFRAEPRYSSRGQVPGNGLLECGAIVRIGRKVLIHEKRFLEWVERQNEVQK